MARGDGPEPLRDLALVELVNRILDRGVVISGELVVSVAQVDLLYLNLNLLLTSTERVSPRLRPGAAGGSTLPGRSGPGAAEPPAAPDDDPPRGSGGTGEG